jgi:hypothetical protein
MLKMSVEANSIETPMTNSEQGDLQAINELRRMAELYRFRGWIAKADELMHLVTSIESRVRREAEIVDMKAFREQHDQNLFEEQA